jgi:hypothetical protein
MSIVIAAAAAGLLITVCGTGVAQAAEVRDAAAPTVPDIPPTPLGGLLNSMLQTAQGLLPALLGGLVPAAPDPSTLPDVGGAAPKLPDVGGAAPALPAVAGSGTPGGLVSPPAA